MITLLRLADPRRFIDGGRLHCPMRSRDVEADACAGCRWLLEIQADGKAPYVRCSPPPTLLVAE
jgi:hypothetical protein